MKASVFVFLGMAACRIDTSGLPSENNSGYYPPNLRGPVPVRSNIDAGRDINTFDVSRIETHAAEIGDALPDASSSDSEADAEDASLDISTGDSQSDVMDIMPDRGNSDTSADGNGSARTRFIQEFPKLACEAMGCPANRDRAYKMMWCFMERWGTFYSLTQQNLCGNGRPENCENWVRTMLRNATGAFDVPRNWAPNQTAQDVVRSCK